MTCESAHPLIEAYLDGELDLTVSLEVEQHIAGCAACARRRDNLRSLSVALKDPALYYRAPASLRRTQPKRSMFPRWVPAFALVFLLTFGFMGIWMARSQQDAVMAQEVSAAHVRSLQAAHLFDVASTDQHTVKPWFAGKLDYSPTVVDLADKGFPLAGGRLDYVGGRAVAALIYRKDKHVINVFTWPGSGSTGRVTSNGLHMIHWSSGGMTYWAISDLNERELQEFGALL